MKFRMMNTLFKGKILLSFFILVFSSLIALQCQRGRSSTSELPIAIVLKTLNNPYFIEMQRGAETAAKRNRVRLIVQAAEREVDVEKQMQIVENLIQGRVSLLCLTPSGSKEIVPAIIKANRAGIPVIILDTRVDGVALQQAGGEIACFIGSDNFEGGRLAGQYLAKRLNGRGKVAILEGIPGHETGDSRLRGFREIIARNPAMQIVASQTANWERDQGFAVFQNILQAHSDLQALFACNDLMALGAAEAIAAQGKTGKIVVTGFDAFSEAREAIQKGTMDATVAQFPFEMGRLGIESAVRVLHGENVDQEVRVPIELITKDRADVKQ